LTAQAVAVGAIPVEHARVIAQLGLRSQRCVELMACPDRGEAFLLAHAYLGLEEFRVFVKAWAYRADPDAAEAGYREAAEDFEVHLSASEEFADLRGRCSPELAELFTVALNAEIGTPARDDRRSPGRRRHDALASILRRVLDCDQLGDLACSRPQVVVHVDYPTLAVVLAHAKNDPDLVDLPGLRPFEGLAPASFQETRAPVPFSVLRRLLCDADLIRVIFGPARQILDVGRAQRTFTGPRRQALNARDQGCVWPGCDAPPWMCQGAHTAPGGWAGGAGTNPEDGALLCYVHHPYVDEHGILMTRTPDGGWEFRWPDGMLIGVSHPRGRHLPGNAGPLVQ
jgi:hypothetical protein